MVAHRRRLFFTRLITVFLMLLVAFPISATLSPVPVVKAASWAGWDAINTIYYNPAQEDAYNPYLATAAGELETYLEQMSARSWSITTGASPAGPAIYLLVDATTPALNSLGVEAYHLVVDNNGIHITGHTALAVRHGAYDVLDRLGVRWFFKNSAWTVVPASMTDIGALDIIEEPDFFWRGIRIYPYEGQADTQAWGRHNRAGGAAYYYSGHSYEDILNRATGYSSMSAAEREAFWNAHASWFLPASGYDSYPWQLNPANADVIQMSRDYAAAALATAPGCPVWYYGDNIPIGAASITPNDGGGWDPPYSDDQAVTDLIFGLSNAVATSIAQAYPGRYVATPSYAAYSSIPSIELEPNVLVFIATAYNYSDTTIPQRIAGIAAQGGVPAIRDYIDIWQWGYDSPAGDTKIVKRIPLWAAFGAKAYEGEAMDDWGGQGHIYYALSRVLWDSSLDINGIFADFYAKAFGPAAATMQNYYEIRDTDNATLAESFRLLKQAETEAAGNNAVLARIRQMECYTYFVWKFNNVGITNLSNAELADFYTFITMIRDWYLVTYSKVEANIHAELTSRGYSSAQITALQDFNTPTNGEVAALMSEALSEWEPYPYTPSGIINPFNMPLVALGDDISQAQTPVTCQSLNILVPSDGNETVSVRVKGSKGRIMWYDSSNMLIDDYEFMSPLADWTTITFNAYMPDTYVIHVPAYYDGDASNIGVDVQGRPVAILASPGWDVFSATTESPYMNDKASFYNNFSGYFYVPEGTDNFTFGYAPSIAAIVSGTLTDPDGDTSTFSRAGQGGLYGEDGAEFICDSPVAGLWKIDISSSQGIRPGYFWFTGIPPLVWHDPEYLLVRATGPAAPPVLSGIGNKTAGMGQQLLFTVFANDPNGDQLTYSASNLPPWATFNAVTRTFSGTPSQTGTYPSVHFQVSDGTQQDSEDITINVVVFQPDINNDGFVNVLDIIDTVQHWYQNGPDGWIIQDINFDGTVNILDLMQIVQHWTG